MSRQGLSSEADGRDGKRQVFWLILSPNAFPHASGGIQWLSHGLGLAKEIQQRDCTGVAPVSLFMGRPRGSGGPTASSPQR